MTLEFFLEFCFFNIFFNIIFYLNVLGRANLNIAKSAQKKVGPILA